MENNLKKKVYKRWWFWVLIFIFVIVILNSLNNSNTPTQSSIQSNTVTSVSVPKPTATSFPDGNWVVGTDIKSGTYRSSGQPNCYYARLSGFGGTTNDIIANENANTSAIITIAPTDKGFLSKNCGTWTLLQTSSTNQKSTTQKTTSAKQQTVTATPTITPVPPQTINQNISTTSNETISQKNAVAKAKNYLNYSAFSHDGLVAQLEYEQFSSADALYGADNSGANWDEQAAAKAKAYMAYSAFSHGSLVAQLEYDKFTQEQAEYGANAVGL